MDLISVKSQIIVETNKFRLGPTLLKLQPLTTGSATKISKIKGVNGAIVPSLGSAPISLFDVDEVKMLKCKICGKKLSSEDYLGDYYGKCEGECDLG